MLVSNTAPLGRAGWRSGCSRAFHQCGPGSIPSRARVVCEFGSRSIRTRAGFLRALWGKSILQVPDTSTRVLDNTEPFLHSSIVNFWITPARSKERKYHIFRQYWYTRNFPVFNKNTGTFRYLGPEVYFFPLWFPPASKIVSSFQFLSISFLAASLKFSA